MKKEKLYKLEEVVKEILEDEELARRDDCYLILRVVEKMYPTLSCQTFKEVMIKGKSKGLSFESITRARRKVQNKYPELNDEEIVENRMNETQEYIEYSRKEQNYGRN